MNRMDIEPFVRKLFSGAGVTEKNIDSVLDERAISLFREAVTTTSFDIFSNYEYLEFKGDAVVNLAAAHYILGKFPEIRSTKWLTKIKHNLISKKSLARISIDLGIEPYIRQRTAIKNKNSEKYMSLMEDVLEAISWVIKEVVESKNKRGVCYAVVYKFLSNRFDMLDISLAETDVFDAKTRLKELYDSKDLEIKKYIRTNENNGMVTVSMTYPLEPHNLTVTQMGRDRKILHQDVARELLSQLKERGIEKSVKEKDIALYKPLPEIEPEFKQFVRGVLESMHLTGVERFLDDYSLEFLRGSFISPLFNPDTSFEMSKFEGVPLLDLIIVEYITLTFEKSKSAKWLTNMKHRILSANHFFLFVKKWGAEKFLRYGDRLSENIKLYPDLDNNTSYTLFVGECYKSFLGALFQLITSKTAISVGYNAVYRLVSSQMTTLNISTKYEDVYHPKSRLKHIYDSQGWSLGQSLKFEYDPLTGLHKVVIIAKIRGNRLIIASATGRTKMNATEEASKLAIAKLKTYNIHDPNE